MKKCGTDFMHQEWGITCTSGESIKVRRNIPKNKLTILDRQSPFSLFFAPKQ